MPERDAGVACLFDSGEGRVASLGSEAVAVHGPIGRFEHLLGSLASLRSAEQLPALAERYSQRLLVGCADEHGMTTHRPANAAERAAMGAVPQTWFRMERLERHATAMRDLLDDLCRWAGADRDDAHVIGFCHGAGTGLPVHCDNVAAVSIQLIGRRQWSVAPNSQPPVGVHDDVPFHVTGPTGIDLPGARSWVAYPGTVSYVPRAWWHETWSPETSFALSLSVPRRADRGA